MYCWNCFEYQLLSCIVKHGRCSPSLTSQMERFERDMLEFKQTISISDIAKSPYFSTGMKSDFIPPHFDCITTQHHIVRAAQGQMKHALIELESFRVDVVSSMKLPNECALQIVAIDAKNDSVVVVEWRTPSELLEVMTSYFCSEDGQSAISRHNISDVVIDGRHPMERQALKRLLDIFDEESPVDENILAGVENVNTCNKVGKSFLSIAAGYGREDVMDLLFNRGADVNFQNEDVRRDTPLMLACEWGQEGAADYLIKRKADVNYVNKDGWTPLMTAVGEGHTNIVELLIQHGGVFLDYQNKEGKTSLSIASLTGNLDIVNLLLGAGAQTNIQDQDGLTALHMATYNGFKNIIEELFAYGADPNITEINTGRSAIFIAAEHGWLEIIKLMIANGAKVDLKDKDGRTVLDVAKECDKTDICEELQKYTKHKESTCVQEQVEQKSKKQKAIKRLEKIFLRSRYEKSKRNSSGDQGDIRSSEQIKNIANKGGVKARMRALFLGKF